MLDNTSDLKILGIAGSLREHSCSQFAVEYAMSRLRKTGCRTRVFDLREAALPFCDGNPDEQSHLFPGVAELRKEVSEAHALVLVSPEYHGGISGVLKNALDLLDARQLAGKVAGVISVLGGMSNGNALNDLSRILRCCHAWVIPQQIAIGRASTVFVGGQIRHLDLRLRFDEFTACLVRSAVRLCSPDPVEIETHAPAA
jgi:FMN reductase